MDVEAVRAELNATQDLTLPASQRARSARSVLIRHGAEAFQITPRPGLALDEIIGIAIGAPQSETRRAFAIILVHAIGIEGVLPTRGETERLIRTFLEQALLNPLRRADYPFDGTPYDKRQALAGLHATIDEHLRPPEPGFPRWIHGLGQRAQDWG